MASARITVDVQPTVADVMTAAAGRVVANAGAAIAATGRFTISLSGGSTPRALYALLATPAYATRIDWTRVHVFWGDERCVSPDDPASNFRMTRESLLDFVPIPPAHVHRIHGEDVPTAAAEAYERELTSLFPGERPRLDLVLLGLGDDGHTASLFPGLASVHESRRLVAAEYAPAQSMWRVTLTPAAFNESAAVLFLVTGIGKANILRQVLEEPRAPERWPAQIISPRAGGVTWLVDANAAALLTKTAPPAG